MTHPTIDVHPCQSEFAQALAEFCVRRGKAIEPIAAQDSDPLWGAVRAAGSRLWLDSGDIEGNQKVWTPEFAAFTTNNSLLNEEVQKGIYDELIPEAAELIRSHAPELDEDGLVLELAFVLNAVHGLRLATAFGANVSVELHTAVARDVDASVEFGRRYHAISPDRFYVKVPLTLEGLIAARRLEKHGVPVNFTLGFSPRQNHLIARFARPHFVNVFLGRVNSLFESDGPARPIGEVAALVSQRHLRELAADGLIPAHTRQIAASMRGGDQVAALTGIDVLTMPVSAAEDFANSGRDPEEIVDHTREDPTAGLEDSFGAAPQRPFWEVGHEVVAATEQLLARDGDTLTPERILAILADGQLGELFGDLSTDDREQIAEHGKLPDRDAWTARVQRGEASWDGLLTEGGLAAFAASQRELDDHVRALL